MKLRILGVPAFFMLFCLGTTAQAQMDPHYNVYATESTDGTYIYTSVLTDGYASGGGIPPDTTHQAVSLTNKLGSSSGWTSGNPDCWTCYISAQDNESINGSDGSEYEFDWEGDINCSYGGLFFTSSGDNFLKIVYASYALQTQNIDLCEYIETCRGTCSGDCPRFS